MDDCLLEPPESRKSMSLSRSRCVFTSKHAQRLSLPPMVMFVLFAFRLPLVGVITKKRSVARGVGQSCACSQPQVPKTPSCGLIRSIHHEASVNRIRNDILFFSDAGDRMAGSRLMSAGTARVYGVFHFLPPLLSTPKVVVVCIAIAWRYAFRGEVMNIGASWKVSAQTRQTAAS